MKSILLLITLIVVAITIFCWPAATPTIASHKQVAAKRSSQAIKFAEKAHHIFCLGGLNKLKPFMVKMEESGYADQCMILEKIKQPQFAQAIVNSPQFNENLLYVTVATADDKKVRFILKEVRNRFLLNSICINE
jgi:hypothetical protein